MNRGTPHISLRIAPEVLECIDRAVHILRGSKNNRRYNRTVFILDAIREKIEKLQRGRESSSKRAGRKSTRPEFDVGPLVDAYLAKQNVT